MNSNLEVSQFSHDPSQALVLPIISRQRFSELTGVAPGVLKGWCDKGLCPTLKIGKYSLINLALLNQMALNKAPWL